MGKLESFQSNSHSCSIHIKDASGAYVDPATFSDVEVYLINSMTGDSLSKHALVPRDGYSPVEWDASRPDESVLLLYLSDEVTANAPTGVVDIQIVLVEDNANFANNRSTATFKAQLLKLNTAKSIYND